MSKLLVATANIQGAKLTFEDMECLHCCAFHVDVFIQFILPSHLCYIIAKYIVGKFI